MRGTNVSARTEACGGPAKPITKSEAPLVSIEHRQRASAKTSRRRISGFALSGAIPFSKDVRAIVHSGLLRNVFARATCEVKVLLRLKTLDRRFGLGFSGARQGRAYWLPHLQRLLNQHAPASPRGGARSIPKPLARVLAGPCVRRRRQRSTGNSQGGPPEIGRSCVLGLERARLEEPEPGMRGNGRHPAASPPPSKRGSRVVPWDTSASAHPAVPDACRPRCRPHSNSRRSWQWHLDSPQ